MSRRGTVKLNFLQDANEYFLPVFVWALCRFRLNTKNELLILHKAFLESSVWKTHAKHIPNGQSQYH